MALSNFYWNTASPNPADDLLISDIPAAIRYVKLNTKTALEREHETLGPDDDGGGEHSNGSAVAYYGTDAATTDRPDGTTLADNTIDHGRLLLNTDTDPASLMQRDTAGTAWIPVVIAAGSLVADSVDEDDIRLTNDGYLTGRNNADDGDIDIIKVNTSDTIDFGAVITIPDGSIATTQSAGDDSTNVATTEYVDSLEILRARGSVTGSNGSLIYHWDTDNNQTVGDIVNPVLPVGDGLHQLYLFLSKQI